MKQKSNKFLLGSGVLTAIAASLCCITPVLALIAGTGGMASSFYWMEPFRPYLMGLTILVLAFAWYQKLKPKKEQDIDCACDDNQKSSFWHSKQFLGIITIFSVLMLTFPYYSSIFFPKNNKKEVIADNKIHKDSKDDPITVKADDFNLLDLNIEGMTCAACNYTVQNAALNVPGVLESTANYKTGKATVKFDKSKTNKEEIIKSINKTHYRVINE